MAEEKRTERKLACSMRRAPADVVKTRRIYSGKMRLQYSTYCVAYGFVVAAVAHVETKVKGSFFSSLLSLLSFLYRRRHLFLEASWPKKLYSNMYSCACLFCVLCRMLAYISRLSARFHV